MLPNAINTVNGWFPSLLNNLFDEHIYTAQLNNAKPAVNVSEDSKTYQVEVAAPGMNKDDFKIQLTKEGNLMISMEKKTCNNDADKADPKKYHRRDFCYSKFEQTFILPDDVDVPNIGATMTDGVLTINLPKLSPEAKPNQPLMIEIK